MGNGKIRLCLCYFSFICMYSDPITKSNILQIFTYTSFNSLFAGFLLSVYFPLSIVNTFYVAVIYRKTENRKYSTERTNVSIQQMHVNI